MTSEKQVQKFYTDDASLPRCEGSAFDWLKFPRQHNQSKALGSDVSQYRISVFFLRCHFRGNRPLALRGHMTNASFKQWVGILLMPKFDRALKNFLTPEIWEETHEARYFRVLWFFNKVVWFVFANMAAKTTLCLPVYLVKCWIVMLRCAVNVTTSSFQHFSWSLSAKFMFRKK